MAINLVETFPDILQLNLSTIDVFDINSYLKDPDSNGSWYQQTTTGDVPAPRIDFCLSYAAAPDNSSYHM